MQPYILDTETTGHPKTPEPFQLSWLALSDGTWHESDTKVRPPHGTFPAAQLVHGVDNRTLMTYPGPDDWFRENREAMVAMQTAGLIIGHSIKYDIEATNRLIARCAGKDGEDVFQPSTLCTYRLAQKILKRDKVGGLSLDACFFYCFPDRLEELKERRASHDALEDCRLTLDVLRELARREWEESGKGEFLELEKWDGLLWKDLVDFADAPMIIPEWSFGPKRGEPFDADLGLCEWMISRPWGPTERPDDFFSAQHALENAAREQEQYDDQEPDLFSEPDGDSLSGSRFGDGE